MKQIASSSVVAAVAVVILLSFAGHLAGAERPWVVYEGGQGPDQGRHIVFVTGDEEYRSEESMPMMARILAVHHGFKCTVLFAINEETGEIDPVVVDNIPGLAALDSADLMVLFVRFRELPDTQMKHIIDYTNSGRPIVALRTATHPFNYKKDRDSRYARWTWNNKAEGMEGGYGRQGLGETWSNHYGRHQKESTLAYIADGMERHPITRGVGLIWGPSDVYGLTTLHGDCKPVLMGQVLSGMEPDDAPNREKKPVPVAWIKTYKGDEGKASRVFTTTMGHAGDFRDEDFRRLFVNACFWSLEMEGRIPTRADVEIVGEYDPHPIGFGGYKKGLTPADHRMK